MSPGNLHYYSALLLGGWGKVNKLAKEILNSLVDKKNEDAMESGQMSWNRSEVKVQKKLNAVLKEYNKTVAKHLAAEVFNK